jgi:microcystin degradation protein MlrC
MARRGRTASACLTIDQGLDEALAAREGPVIVADPADNAGGGAASDNTSILRALLERKAERAAIGPIWDPVATSLCFNAGVGASFRLRIGGKLSASSGEPVDELVQVVGLRAACVQTFGPVKVATGDCAAVRIGGIDVVLCSIRVQAFGTDLFTNVGIDPATRAVVVVKSTNHFLAAFGPIAAKVLYVESDGPLRSDYRQMPYLKVRRPIWPLDEVTFPALVY